MLRYVIELGIGNNDCFYYYVFSDDGLLNVERVLDCKSYVGIYLVLFWIELIFKVCCWYKLLYYVCKIF